MAPAPVHIISRLICQSTHAILPEMSKQIGIIAAVIILVAVIGAVAFTQLSKPSSTPQTGLKNSAVQEISPTESVPSNIKGTIASLLSGGKNLSCTISYPDNKMSGTTYVSGNKMRGDFLVKAVKGKDMESHMIRDGEHAYMWSSAKGTKIKLDTLEKTISSVPSGSPTNQTGTADLNKEVDLKCNPWLPDNSKFAVPANVTFTDLSETMKKVQEQTGKMKELQKSACNAITDPVAKEACTKALGGK